MSTSAIRNKVFKKTPILKQIIEAHGGLTLQNYALKNLKQNHLVAAERQTELLEVIEQKITQTLGAEAAQQTVKELRTAYIVSTADHHGPITHPFFLSGHLNESFARQDLNLKTIVALSFGSVSLNNSSFPRGLLFHHRSLANDHLPLWGLEYRHHPVYGLRAYTQKEIAILEKNIQKKVGLTIDEKQTLLNLVQDIYAKDTVLALPTYADQVTLTNYHLWKKIPGQENINFVSLTAEEITSTLLLKHLAKPDTVLSELLLNKKYHVSFLEHFDGIQGAFNQQTKKGTVFFWAIQNNTRAALHLLDNKLISTGGTYILELNPEALHDALVKKEIMPNMALCFIVLSFYYGLTCGGGFSQVSYLALMKKAYIKLLNDMRRDDEIARCAIVPTDILSADFSFLNLIAGKKTAGATTLDLILYQNTETASELRQLAHTKTLASAIDKLMNEFYKILYHETATTTPSRGVRHIYDSKEMPRLR